MFFRILKKDLKRKKTMNIILLIFVIISAMFAAASAQNISAVTSGIRNFLDLADAPDMQLWCREDSDLEDKIAALDTVSSIKTERNCFFTSDMITLNGKPLEVVNGSCFYSDIAAKYFDSENNEITEVQKGSFYCTKNAFVGIDAPEKGDLLELNAGGRTFTLRYEGTIKDAVNNTTQQGSPRFMINEEDYTGIAPLSTIPSDNILYIKTSDPDAVRAAADGYNDVSVKTKADMENNFFYDKLTAYILLAICGVMLLTSFVVLRFAVGFTITEEFREISVMKAVGINNFSIRSLYITKYAAIAIVGSAIGFGCSIPLSKMLLDTISQNIVFNGKNDILLGAAGAGAVILAILLFCYSCTRKIKKYSPIDAMRNGQTGERFGRRSLMQLGRSRLPATGFLAMNDVASSPKQFVIITVVFTLCVLMMTIMSNMGNTLSSDKPIRLFSIPEQTDLSIMEAIDGTNEAFGSGFDYQTLIDKTEKTLADNGIPGKCSVTYNMTFLTSLGDKTENIDYIIAKNVSADTFTYDEGSAPMKEDEVAVTEYTLDKLGAQIGDRINIDVQGEKKELLITGTFSSFMNNGYCARLCESTELIPEYISNFMGVQIIFDSDPDAATLKKYEDKVKDIFGVKKVLTNAELVDLYTELSGTMQSIKRVMMLITVIVTTMIIILMERSFISKEKNEIALMKAVGLRSRSIIGQHVMRFFIAALIAAGAASALVLPVSKWLLNFIFSLIGSVKNISVAFDSVEIFVICPLILLSVTLIGTFLTSLYTKTITASDAASID